MRSLFLSLLALVLFAPKTNAETGYDLWLRYTPVSNEIATKYNGKLLYALSAEKSPTISIAVKELNQAIEGLLQRKVVPSQQVKPNAILLGTTKNKTITTLIGATELNALHNDGYILKQLRNNGKPITLVAAKTEAGVLYGTYALIRYIQTGTAIETLSITESPLFDKRILNHWDNLNGTVERGYAGRSIFWNYDIPTNELVKRHTDYARANASIGINGTVINNVNATPQMLTAEYLQKTAEIANRLRHYKIQVYLSINFSSPKELGGLTNSDPLNPEVANWWKNKVKEIYTLIPDFGGFLVKANSEGLPGPQDYGRTHADGANMLADALKPFGGLVMWRAFVYNPSPEDRAKQAYLEFKPLDGQFRDNVIVQVKNGPVDFQPREPFSPLFGGMEKTSLMMEFQITQEYLGFSNHLVYLSPMYKECFDTDTYSKGNGSTVAKTLDGTLFNHPTTAIAGVANIGRDTNWCGHHFAQSNWYAFGRLAWNHSLTSEQIADEWIKMTFTDNDEFVEPIKNMMLQSHESCVNYMTPIGLHHIMGWDHHYGPEPWCFIENARPDWLPNYYHRAAESGLGFDRSSKGSNTVAQYHEPLRSQINNIETCPIEWLLWFHHVPWNYKLNTGRDLWNELVHRYYAGANDVKEYQRTWDKIENSIDAQRFKEVQYKLKIQARDAIWWRDACLLYFQTYSKMPIPLHYERPLNDLDDLKKIKLNMGHHN